MLHVGQQRARSMGYNTSTDGCISFIEGNAEELPFASNTFDAYTIAFCLRNVTNVQKAVDEAYRVLKKGGRFLCLEFSHVENPVMKQLYDTYSYNIIPLMGQVIANDRESYEYLVQSIRKFVDQETLLQMMKTSGFKAASYVNMTFGVVAVHSGFKI